MPIPAIVEELVERFDLNRAAYHSGRYNEAQVRQEFINPFWEALGWDVYNRQGYSERFKEVVHEDALKVQGKNKAPDYAFRLGGQRVFFVEAKKPAVRIKEEVSPAYQLRRYAWSAKLPLSLLTDFEEFAAYDCRSKPAPTDKASTARVMYLTYRDYPARWDEIAGLFSPEAIRKGALDRYVESTRAQRGTAEVDAAFLAEIEGWREALARNIALRNPGLSVRQLNFAVQMTIDRLIFLRICEDRGIEPYHRLGDVLTQGKGLYAQLGFLFRQADDRYNSGLFHFNAEKGREGDLDEFTLGLQVDDRVLQEIVGGLYYPDCPYEFSVLPADILGQVYEQFLGKVIRLTPAGRAKVEEKPEVKKAGGVYYTPTYIVDYIVEQTVGRLLEDKTPRQVRGSARVAPLRILDPACGSGTFLLQAYQCLLDWYLERYVAEDAALHARQGRLAPTAAGEWRLASEERKRILLDHIYGVDIDPQAVEVTKLSLLLKVLEEEGGGRTADSARQLSFAQERALPDLAQNVRCGNSLIGPDYYQGRQLALLNEDEMYRVNAFDWKEGFPRAMAAGGFDAVIGNPPYGALFEKEEKAYIRETYASYKYKYDSYVYFIEKALALTKQGGWVSFITPELWLRLENCVAVRQLIAEHAGFDTIRIFGENVFADAVVNTVVFVLQRAIPRDFLVVRTANASWQISTEQWQQNGLLIIDYRLKPEVSSLVAKIRRKSIPLESFGEVIQGITPYDRYRGQDPALIKRRGYHFDHKKDDTCGKWLAGRDVGRYCQTWGGEWLSYGPWLAAPREERFFKGPRLLFREIPGKGKRIQATFVQETLYYGHSITPFKPLPDAGLAVEYLLGISNARLLSWYGGLTLSNFGKDIFPKLNPQDIKQLPICTIDSGNPKDVARHDCIVSAVENMLDLHEKLADAKTPQAKRLLQQQIEVTDREIDRLVYELYGLMEQEIAIVEGRAAE